jgi:hypothetical protein
VLKLAGPESVAIDPHVFVILLGQSDPLLSIDDTLDVPVLPTDSPESGSVDQTISFRKNQPPLPTGNAAGAASSTTLPSSPSEKFTFSQFRYLGRVNEGQAPIILSDGKFVPVNFVAAFRPLPGGIDAAPHGGSFDCEVRLADLLTDSSMAVTYGDEPDTPSTTQ